MKVRVPSEPCPPVASDLPTEPLTLAKLRRLAETVNDLAERIEAVGLTAATRADVDRLRLTVRHSARWDGLRDGSGPPWAGEAEDLLTKALSPLNWCYASDGGKHTDSEIVAALRRLSARMAKLAGGQAEPVADRGWTPEEAAEIVAGLRTLAAAVDCEPSGHATGALAARIEWSLANVYGGLCGREETADEMALAAIVGSTMTLLQKIEQRALPADTGAKLRAAADAMEAAFGEIDGERPAASPAGPRSGTKPPKRHTRRSKTPAEVLNEARERHAAKILARRRVTVRELAQELECSPSTASRLKAWRNRGVNDYELPRGYRLERADDEGGANIEGIAD